MSFIDINNKQDNAQARYSAGVIREALLSIETKSVAKADSMVESIEGELTLSEALEFFTAKLNAMNALNVALRNETSIKENEKHEILNVLNGLLNEGTMSEIHMLAKEAKDIADFTKKFFKEFGDKIKKTADAIEWVESLYTDTIAESLIAERSINKIQKEFSEVVTDMATTVASWKTAEGDTKIQLLDKLKALTARKAELTSELDGAVMGKDKDAVLSAIEESVANEAFSRMAGDTIENELYTATQKLSDYYDWLKAGNDSGKGKTLDEVISLLKKCKNSIKRFNSKEEVEGTTYESVVTEAKDAKKDTKKIIKLINQNLKSGADKQDAIMDVLLDGGYFDETSDEYMAYVASIDSELVESTNETESAVTEGVDENKPYFDFLVALRDSGATNMFGASPYLQDAFDLSKSEARKILAAWMKSFNESVVNEAKAVKVTKQDWPYVEFKVGGKKHKVEFDYEDIIDDHGNEGQDQYWIGKDEDGKEWSIDVYADYNGEVEEVHYDTIVAESKIALEIEETPSWNNLMETINYKLNEDLRRDLKKYIKQNEDELNKLADEDAFDTIYDNIRAEFDITEGTKEDRDMIETFKFMF